MLLQVLVEGMWYHEEGTDGLMQSPGNALFSQTENLWLCSGRAQPSLAGVSGKVTADFTGRGSI